MAPDTRAYSAGKLMLELDGKDVGILVAGEGGEPVAAVIAEADPTNVVRKHLGEVTYSPIRMSFGSGMGEPLYQWIADWLGGKQGSKSGALVFLDMNFQEQSRLEFEEALITEFGFPALNAGSKDPARFSLTLQPVLTRGSKGSGKRAGLGSKATKTLLASNFRLAIDNLPGTNKVMRVDALVVRQAPSQPPEIPDLVFTLAEAESAGVVTWFEELVQAKHGDQGERSGTLQMLGPDMMSALFTLTLSNLGVYRVERSRFESAAETIASVRVSAYCEQIGLSFTT